MLTFMQAPSGGTGGSRRSTPHGSDYHLSAGVLMAKAVPAAPSPHERTPQQQQQQQQKRQMRRRHSISTSVYRAATSTVVNMNTSALVVPSACESVNNTRNPVNMTGMVTPMPAKAQESRRTTLVTTFSSSLSTVASTASPSKLLAQQQRRAEPIANAPQPTSTSRRDTPQPLRSRSSFSSSSSSSCLSSSSPVQVLIKHAHKKHQQPRLLTHNRNSSQTQLSSSRAQQQQQQQIQDELPILRYQYIARDVKVLIGTRWKFKKFETKTIVLHTSSANNGSPTLTICAKTPIESDTSAVKFAFAMDLTCVHSGPNGLKLKSSSGGSTDAFRLKIRFVTPADASIWFNLIHEAMAHARWVRDVEETSCLSKDPMATVLVARHVPTDQDFVIKVLPRVRVDDGSCTEILVLKKLFKAVASSPPTSALRHILEYRVIETLRDVRIVMPKLPGKNLLQFLQQQEQPNQQQHTLSESDARSVLLGLCESLYALHAVGTVHCDLKLENILLTDVSNVRVIDFGGAFDISSTGGVVTSTSQGGARLKHKIKAKSQRAVVPRQQQHQRVMMVGTPGYIAPERILFVDEPPTPAADVFSAGIVLFQMLTGRQPFTRASRHRALSMQDTTVLHWHSAEKILASHGVSSAATQLIERMVESDSRSRITVEELFCHPWLCC